MPFYARASLAICAHFVHTWLRSLTLAGGARCVFFRAPDERLRLVRGGWRPREGTVPRKLDAKGNKSNNYKDPCAAKSVISRVSRFVSLFGCYSEAHTPAKALITVNPNVRSPLSMMCTRSESDDPQRGARSSDVLDVGGAVVCQWAHTLVMCSRHSAAITSKFQPLRGCAGSPPYT